MGKAPDTQEPEDADVDDSELDPDDTPDEEESSDVLPPDAAA